MKIERLTSLPDGTIAAAMVMASGKKLDVTFTTAHRGGIAVANPDQAIFEREELDAASVRAIIAAVLAFHSVAAYSPGRPE
jgi:hypothetical protein